MPWPATQSRHRWNLLLCYGMVKAAGQTGGSVTCSTFMGGLRLFPDLATSPPWPSIGSAVAADLTLTAATQPSLRTLSFTFCRDKPLGASDPRWKPNQQCRGCCTTGGEAAPDSANVGYLEKTEKAADATMGKIEVGKIPGLSMNTRLWGLTLCCLTSLLPSTAIAATNQAGHCALPSDLRTLSGIWQAQALVQVRAGVASSTQRLQLEVGANGQIRAKRDWTANNIGAGTIQGLNRLGKPAFQDSEAMIGWIQPRSCRIVMVELDDRGQANGWLRRDGRGFYLQLEVTQSGTGAVVFFADFRRSANGLNRAKPNP